MGEQIILSGISLDQLRQLLAEVVRQESGVSKEEFKEQLLSPDEARKLFVPAITRPTLQAYTDKGYFQKYKIGGRTWYKYSELISALSTVKKYQR